MTSAPTLLRLMWLASPALPVGGFSYSEGLESAVDAQHVTNETQAGSWLLDQLHLAQARSDLSAAVQAFHAWQTWKEDDLASVEAVNRWVCETRESAEFGLQARQMGRSLVEWLRHGEHGSDPRVAECAALQPSPTWPVAFALAGVLAEASARETLLALAFGWAENMVQAAMKAVPLGQASGQRILSRLANAIPAAVDDALAQDPSQRQAFTPGLAILSSRHEAQYSRLFRS